LQSWKPNNSRILELGENVLKLRLLFIIMDLLTLLAYPIVYVDGRLRQVSKPKENIKLANLLFSGSVTAGR
jgi:hypothetical protein